MRPNALLAFLVLLTPAAAQAQDAVAAGRPVDPDAAIRVFLPRGSLRITAWAAESVAVRGRVDPAVGRFTMGGTRSALKLWVEPPAGRTGSGTADLDIRVPQDARLWVSSPAAEIEVTLNGGSIEVAGASGRVRLAGRARSASVETLDGNVELALDADVGRVRTASGTIVVRGVIQDLDASTVSGPLLVGMEGKVAHARMETVSSEIAFKGDLLPDGRLDAETHSGDVELRLPPTLGADYHLVSYARALQNQMVPPETVHRGAQKGEWRFRIGDGRATVDVRTFKGVVTLKARGPEPERRGTRSDSAGS